MKKYLLMIILLGGCQTATIPRAIIPPQPKQTESVLPNIKKVDSGIIETITNNTKIGEKIQESKITISDQNISIVDAIAQAEKIKEKALAKVAVSELEATNLLNELKKVQIRNLFLEKQNSELSKLREDQEKVLQIIQTTLDKTKEQVIDKENETDQLRIHDTFLAKSLSDKNDESEKLKLLLQQEKETSASAKVYKNWVISLVSIFIGWLIVKNILMSIFPALRIRI